MDPPKDKKPTTATGMPIAQMPQQQPQKVSNDLNEIMRRLRILEERYSNLRKKSQISDQNMLEDSKRIFDQIAAVESIITEMKKEVNEVNLKMRLLDEEISGSVQKRELNVLTKYLELWEPMDFIKKEEARQIIEDMLEELKNTKIQQ